MIVSLFVLTLSGCQSLENHTTVIEDGGSGYYKAVIVEDEGLPGFTIYRPENMDFFGSELRLPIVLWGNGDCQNTSRGYKNFLNEIASYGYFVIASGSLSSLYQHKEEKFINNERESAKMIEALDWVMAENSRKTSRYYGKIDITKVASGGQSCGGLKTIEVSADPRVTASIICNSRITNAAMSGGDSTLPFDKEILKLLRAPILYLAGEASNSAYAITADELERIDNVPVVIMLNQNTENVETYEQPHGGSFAFAAIAWLNWQLKGYSSMFDSLDCHCPYSLWKIEYRNFE